MSQVGGAPDPVEATSGSPLAVRRTSDPAGMDRIEFFSDAVFAIAMTLLVVTLVIPATVTEAGLNAALHDLSGQLFAFALSFIVLGQFWIAHHRLFRLIDRYDLGLLWLNLFHLLGICFVPFPTELLGRYFGSDVAGFLYGGTLTLTSLFGASIWFYALGRQLVGSVDPDVRRAMTFRATMTPIAFAIGTAFVPVSMGLAVVVWGVLLPLSRAIVTVAARAKTA